MRKRLLAVFALLVCLCLLAPSLIAKNQGRGKGKQEHEGGQDKNHEQVKSKHKDKAKDKHRGDERWERRDSFEYRFYGDREGRPPGWSRGKKTGWGNCGLPPGQAKKYGECRTYQYQGRRYYYYRDDLGRLVVRRPVLSVEVH
ncbi:MAG: hypothetical protein ACE14M_12025 [Terriglobales bacterium]